MKAISPGFQCMTILLCEAGSNYDIGTVHGKVQVKDCERVEQVILRKVRLQNATGELPPVNHSS